MSNYTDAAMVGAEGARIGLTTCTRCGALVIYDPRDKRPATKVHDLWHDNQPTDERVSVGQLRRLRAFALMVSDLDRSPGGRHEGDAESGTPEGVSPGNPHMQVGEIIGYSMDRVPYVMPSRPLRSDPEAWKGDR